MKALITGASSGIGREFAKNLSKEGYDLIIVSRDEENLNKLKSELNTNVRVIAMDLSDINNCKLLYENVKDEDIDLLINNAGFGLFGNFDELDLEKQLNMVDLNVKSVHVLTNLFLKDMIKKDSGKILNVASIAGVMPAGPLMATYYATKAYVLSLTEAIGEELRRRKSSVKIYALCPGPVNTNFNNVAGVQFNIKPLSAEYVSKYALKKINGKKNVIIPGFINKLVYLSSKIVPNGILVKCAYNAQVKKMK